MKKNLSHWSDPEDQPIVAWIGLDWADQKHDAVVRCTEQSEPEHSVIAAKPAAIEQWVGALRQRFGSRGKVAICLEQSRGALIYQLMQHDFLLLYPINPKQLSKYREAWRVSGAKDDPNDSDLLSEIVYLHASRLKLWKPEPEQSRKLALLCQKRRQCVDDRTRLSNQIKSELKGYYPLALELLEGHTSTALAADLLVRWPTLAALQKAKADSLRRFFYLHNCRREEKIQARLQAIASALALTKDAAIVEPSALRVLSLAKQLRSLLPVIGQYDQQIEKLFQSHPDFKLFDSLPGAGLALAPRLAAAFGTDRTRYESALQFATFVGIAPIRIASGKSRRFCFRWACPKFLRQSLHEFAACSIHFCQWAAQFYQAFRQRNDNHHAAVRALALKWIRILFRCWQQGVPYDEQLYLRALKARHSPYTQNTPPTSV